MSDLGKHEQAFTGRGGAGNYVIKNPIPEENLPKAYTQKPIAGNFSGRGGAGNYKSRGALENLPDGGDVGSSGESFVQASPALPTTTGEQQQKIYKAGRGGAGNIEAVKYTETQREDRALEEARALQRPQEPERPILRID